MGLFNVSYRWGSYMQAKSHCARSLGKSQSDPGKHAWRSKSSLGQPLAGEVSMV